LVDGFKRLDKETKEIKLELDKKANKFSLSRLFAFAKTIKTGV